jgi:hypothetical protein
MLRRVALVKTDVSEEFGASFNRVTRIVPSLSIIVTLMKEALGSPKRFFLQEPHGVTSQKTPFFNIKSLFSLRNMRLNTVRSEGSV